MCPPVALFLVNTYRCDVPLCVDGETLLSKEGTTQGDPMAMPMYALATIPLIKKVAADVKQIWYADDASAGGSVKRVLQLVAEGPG